MITISPDPFPFKSHLPKCIQTRYVPNKIRFWRVQYQFVKMHGYHVYVPRCARVTFSLQLRENGRNNSQHCWPNIAGSCCVRLHVAKSLNGFKLCTTTCNSECKQTRHVTSNNVGSCWPTMLCPFARGLY